MYRLAILAVLTASLAGCSSRDSEESTANPQQTTSAQDTALGHVHGLGVDPGDGTLYVASHYGVFRVEDGVPGRVADRWQDTMGFAVVGPGHFLGSGHPDLRDDLPPHLGLIESVDGGESWTSVSRLGEADFHAIEPVGNRIYAYDSISGSLQVTTDRESWDTIATLAVIDLAADPDAPETVYATTERGVLVRSTDRGEPTRVAGAPTLTAIDWEADGPLVGIAPDGTVLLSTDGATDWRRAGALDGPVEALEAAPGRWHASTEHGIYESTDDGVTWDRVVAHGG